jgi:hypothetical protein
VGQFSATKVANLSFRRRRHAKKTQEAILLLRKPLLLLPLAITTFEKLCALPFLVHWAIKTFCVPSLKKSQSSSQHVVAWLHPMFQFIKNLVLLLSKHEIWPVGPSF